MKLVLAARGSQEAGFTKPAGENYELCTAACVFFVDSCKGASIYDIRSGGGGGGSPKSRRKEHNQLIYDIDSSVAARGQRLLSRFTALYICAASIV